MFGLNEPSETQLVEPLYIPEMNFNTLQYGKLVEERKPSCGGTACD